MIPPFGNDKLSELPSYRQKWGLLQKMSIQEKLAENLEWLKGVPEDMDPDIDDTYLDKVLLLISKHIHELEKKALLSWATSIILGAGKGTVSGFGAKLTSFAVRMLPLLSDEPAAEETHLLEILSSSQAFATHPCIRATVFTEAARIQVFTQDTFQKALSSINGCKEESIYVEKAAALYIGHYLGRKQSLCSEAEILNVWIPLCSGRLNDFTRNLVLSWKTALGNTSPNKLTSLIPNPVLSSFLATNFQDPNELLWELVYNTCLAVGKNAHEYTTSNKLGRLTMLKCHFEHLVSRKGPSDEGESTAAVVEMMKISFPSGSKKEAERATRFLQLLSPKLTEKHTIGLLEFFLEVSPNSEKPMYQCILTLVKRAHALNTPALKKAIRVFSAKNSFDTLYKGDHKLALTLIALLGEELSEWQTENPIQSVLTPFSSFYSSANSISVYTYEGIVSMLSSDDWEVRDSGIEILKASISAISNSSTNHNTTSSQSYNDLLKNLKNIIEKDASFFVRSSAISLFESLLTFEPMKTRFLSVFQQFIESLTLTFKNDPDALPRKTGWDSLREIFSDKSQFAIEDCQKEFQRPNMANLIQLGVSDPDSSVLLAFIKFLHSLFGVKQLIPQIADVLLRLLKDVAVSKEAKETAIAFLLSLTEVDQEGSDKIAELKKEIQIEREGESDLDRDMYAARPLELLEDISLCLRKGNVDIDCY